MISSRGSLSARFQRFVRRFFFYINLVCLSISGSDKDNRQNGPRRGQPDEDLPRDGHTEEAAPSAHHPPVRTDGDQQHDLHGHRVRERGRDIR